MKRVVSKRVLNLLLIITLVFPSFTNVFAGTVSADEVFADDLFISEYIEGGSFNKAIEIYNGTGETVDLSSYTVELYSNGATEASQSLTLSGTLNHSEVLVLAHASASAEILSEADVTNSAVINFNGDDPFVLKKNGTILDIIGEIGVRANVFADKTLVRNSSITSGNTTYTETEWSIYSKDTFSYLGSHTMDGVEPGDPGDPGEDPGDGVVDTIAEAKNLSVGTTVTVEGVVTADNSAIGGGRLSTYIQDETAGINVFAYNLTGFPDLQKGDLIEVTGKIDEYNGLLEVVPSSPADVVVVSQGNDLPEPVEITLADLQDAAIAEPLEGSLVKVNGYVSSIPSTPAGGGYNISLIDADFNGTTLRVMEGSLDVSQLEEGKWYDITAILSQYNSYQIIPTEASDIQLATEQPPAPSAAGEYTSTVRSVTDGDTIRLETPVLGSDRVRFVNIDTPETSVAGANGAHEANQKEHGQAATAHLQTLLQPGDVVTLKIGDEPTDDYGRLLAEVINKDGINTNLEQVKQGYAVTYFLWPYGEDEVFEEYQAAAKDAIDNELGIWNPENPLIELPFEYRAITEGGDFDKYVGHYDTKKYVEPLDFKDVPVEKRVFFWSESDAVKAGYSPEDGVDPGDPGDDTLSVQLLSLNDLHGKIDQEYELDLDGDGNMDGMFGRMDYVSAYLKQREQENPNTIMVHAGDMIGGSSPVSALFQDEPTVEIMEEIGFDVGTVGNHEFDEGTQELLRMVSGGDHPDGLGTEGYDGMNFDVLCANCVYRDSGETILPPYAIEEIDGERIGFIGVNTQASAGMVMPAGIQDIEFTDEATAVNNAVSELKAQGIKAIVVLAHIPATQSGDTSATGEAADLARAIDDEVDVIFAAHNHVVVDGVVDNKLIVQAYEYGKAFADVDLEIDRTTGNIVSKEAEIVYVDQSTIEPDEEVATILNKYSVLIEDKMNEVLGYNANDMTGDYSNDGDHGLGNLIADGMKWAMDSDFAMMNGGGIRDDLLAGDVTWGDLFNIQPFGNVLMKLEIKGADLEPIINAQLSDLYGPDYSIAGFHYTWDPETTSVVDITFPDGTPIDPNETYTLTVNNYMGTSTGSKYRPIGELGQNPEMGPVDVDASVEFVKSLNSSVDNPIDYGPEGRITIATEEDPGLGEVSIEEARAAAIGSKVTIEGVVTYIDGSNYYVQDETAGIVIRSFNLEAEIGDKVKATGATSEYFELLQMITEDVEVVEVGAGTPDAKVVTSVEIGEAVEGQLVKVNFVNVESVNEFNEFTASDSVGSFVIDSDDHLVEVDHLYESVTGVVTYSFGEYKVIPRFSSDVEKLVFVDGPLAEQDLADVTSKIVEVAEMYGIEFVTNQLHVELTEVVKTKGNTKQHIQSAINHISKSLLKLEQGKGNRAVEIKKIQHELEKLNR